MKLCTKCLKTRDSKDFRKNKTRKDGLHNWCKCCERDYRIENPESYKKANKKWVSGNRDKSRGYSKKYYENNRQYFSDYYQNTKSDTNKLRQRADIQRLRETKLQNQKGIVPIDCWDIMIGLYGERCMWPGCKKSINETNPLTLDHVIPLELATFETKLHDISNFQILCKSHNSSKRTKIMDFRPFVYLTDS